jgi:Spy/CpxP family protein refolding chaperone
MKARIALALAAWLAAGLAFADPHSEHGGPNHGPDMDRMAILLDLNDTQKTQVQDILEQQHEKMRAAHDEHQASGTRPSREEMTKEHEQFRQQTVTRLQAVLTPEQIKKFEALTDHRPGRH